MIRDPVGLRRWQECSGGSIRAPRAGSGFPESGRQTVSCSTQAEPQVEVGALLPRNNLPQLKSRSGSDHFCTSLSARMRQSRTQVQVCHGARVTVTVVQDEKLIRNSNGTTIGLLSNYPCPLGRARGRDIRYNLQARAINNKLFQGRGPIKSASASNKQQTFPM